MMRSSSLLAAGFASILLAGSAFAQSATPAAPSAPAAPSTPAPATAPATKGGKPRSAQSIACSGKADQQNLHGKPRKTFMSKCKAGKA